MKIIDGSILEGGGQILRMSAAFSSLLGIPIKIERIRAGRQKPGLKAQHVTGIKLVQKLCRANVHGCDLHSNIIEFTPSIRLQENQTTEFSAEIGTAGAITLLCQVSLPCLLFSGAKSEISILLKGGTNVGMAPQIEYYKYVFKPNLNRFGADFICNDFETRKGYFPKGGGYVNMKVLPLKEKFLNAVSLEDPGEVSKITIFSSVAGVLPIKMAYAMVDSAKRVLEETFPEFKGIQMCVNVKKEENSFGNGSSIVIVAETTTGCVLGGSGLGSPKEQPSSVGEGAAKELIRSVTEKVCFDEYMQDQMIIFMALAKGVSRIMTGPLTLHTETAIHIATELTDAKFSVIPLQTDNTCNKNIIQCHGIGYE